MDEVGNTMRRPHKLLLAKKRAFSRFLSVLRGAAPKVPSDSVAEAEALRKGFELGARHGYEAGMADGVELALDLDFELPPRPGSGIPLLSMPGVIPS